MNPRLTTLILLAAIALQGIFGGLKDSALICLGGGHEHDTSQIVERCETVCSGHSDESHHAHHSHHVHHSHHTEWPEPTSTDDDQSNGCCTDLELPLIVLLTHQRTQAKPIVDLPPLPAIIALRQDPVEAFYQNEHASIFKEDPGGLKRITRLKTTRLII